MNDLTNELKTINDKLFDLSNERTKLKIELYQELSNKTFNESIIDGCITTAEIPVYLYDVEKKYTNEQARKTGVKTFLNQNDVYISSVDLIVLNNQKINSIDIKLRNNQSEIDFQKRLFDILMKEEN